MKIDRLNLSVRAWNCLKRAGIDTVEQLRTKTTKDLQKIRGMGVKTIEEIRQKLQDENATGPQFTMSMTEEQAKIVSVACEFYARIRMGQFNEVLWRLFDIHPLPDDYYQRRELAEKLLLEVRRQIYPDLYGPGHSYGMGKFKDADLAFDVHQVIRHAMGDDREPFSYYPLPMCTKEE